jgi:hypothetical protein
MSKEVIKVVKIQWPIDAIQYKAPASAELKEWLVRKFIEEKISDGVKLFDRSYIRFYTGQEGRDFEKVKATAYDGDWIFGDEILDVLPSNEFKLYFKEVE